MSKSNSAPTVGYVLSSQIYKWIAGISVTILIILVLVIVGFWIRLKATMEASCEYERTVNIQSLRFDIIGINKDCNEPQ